jgi:DNA-binding NtrC family response regulator
MAADKRVAIVEDEEDVARTYELLLRRRSIPVAFTALDGPEAIAMFRRADPRPAVVLIDYRLPSMSGLEVMKEVLALEPGTKVVFISGDEAIEEESLDAGASVFLQKPANIKAITDAVTGLLNS